LQVSPSQLSQIVSGKRQITAQFIKQVAKKLSLSPSEVKRVLQAHLTPEAAERGLFHQHKLQEDQFALIADWYHFAILSLTKVKGARKDPAWIANRLGITQQEARASLERLERLRILSPGSKFKQISDPISATSEIPSQAIQRFHRGILGLAIEKLASVPVEQRDYSVITFAGNTKKMKRVKELIENFQNEISEMMESSEHDQVYSLACQIFPLIQEESK
jgi:uncharacterized protein (TIGR02147 family)